MTKNHFATLGVNIGAEEDEIKKAFRSLAKVWHPDKNKNPGAEEKFKEISAAYDYLQNKDRREILTRELTKKQEPSSGSYTQPTPTSNRENKGTETKPSQEPDTANKAGPSCSKENHKEGASKKKTHWSDSFRTGKSKKNARDTDWKPWNRDWTDGFDASTSPSSAKFSAAFYDFQTFVDHLGEEFGPPASRGFQFTAFCSEEDPFEQGLGLRPRPQTKPKQPKAKSPTRCVAPEHGYAGGLDEQYLFSPRTSPSKLFLIIFICTLIGRRGQHVAASTLICKMEDYWSALASGWKTPPAYLQKWVLDLSRKIKTASPSTYHAASKMLHRLSVIAPSLVPIQYAL